MCAIHRRAFLLQGLSVAALGGCAANSELPDAPEDVVARAAYAHEGPPALTLYTMISNRSGSGAHSSLMVNASQRVVFDPAGSVRLSAIPERGDVLYGITPAVAEFYARAHARSTYHVRIQELEVPAGTAARALEIVSTHGRVAPARCTVATSGVLQRLPGFEAIRTTWFPNALADQFATFPGVSDRRLYEDDADDKRVAIAAFEAETGAQPIR